MKHKPLVFVLFILFFAFVSCQKEQPIQKQPSVAKYISTFGSIIEKDGNSILIEFPESIEVVGYTADGQYVKSRAIRVTCECKAGGSCDPFYVPQVGKAGCLTDNCSNCSMTTSTTKGVLESFALLYAPKDDGAFLAMLNFTDTPYEPAEYEELGGLSCTGNVDLSQKDIEAFKEMFVEPVDYNKPFFLYPMKYQGKVFYVATSKMTIAGYYIPVASIESAKCEGCNGNCKLQRKYGIIFCNSTCDKCTLEIK